MHFEALNVDRGSIVLMRVENGWVARTDAPGFGNSTPLRVAETPAALVQIVRDWAIAQTERETKA